MYIVIESEIARWLLCKYLVEFCVTKTTGGWDWRVDWIGRGIVCITTDCVHKVVPKIFT